MQLTVEAAAQIAAELEKPCPRYGTVRTLCGGFRAPDGAAFSIPDLSVPVLVGTSSDALHANFWMVPDATADEFADRLATAWEAQDGYPALVGIWVAPEHGTGGHLQHLVGSIAGGSSPRLSKRPPPAFTELFAAGLGQQILVTDKEDQWAFELMIPVCVPLFTATGNQAAIEAQFQAILTACAPSEVEDVLVALNDHLQEAHDHHRQWIDAFIARERASLMV